LKKFGFIFLWTIFFITVAKAQTNTIKIQARLFVETNTINIKQYIYYTNTSKDTLKTIQLNNWPNSFRNRKTKLAKRMLEDYDRKFHFAKAHQRGFTNIISISVNYHAANYGYLKNKSDIITINLEQALPPSKSLEIIATYKVKLPDISLTGYGASKNNYYLKYWYLIPAVYNNHKWQSMENINLNDLYSLPYNYEVDFAAPPEFQLTTNLIVATSFVRKQQKHYVMHCNTTSDAEIYLQYDKNFEKFVTKDIDVYTDIPSKNLNKTLKKEILNRQVAFIESYLGKFPYPKIVLTQVAYQKNPLYGFNQLPKFVSPFNDTFEWDMKIFKTLVKKYIDRSLIFNLRNDAWLPNGIQTYLMMHYVATYYKDVKAIGNLSKFWLIKKFNISKLKFNGKYPFVYQFAARKNLDQALSTRNDSLSNFNRKIVNKYKAGIGLQYLDAYLGDNVVKKTFKLLDKKYLLQKVNSKEFETLLKSKTNKPLDWFFKDYIHTSKKIDYTITKAVPIGDSIAVTIKNKRNITTPVILYGIKNKNILYKRWYTGIDSFKTVKIPKKNIDKVVLNYQNLYPEYNLRNNWKKLHKTLFNRPVQFRFLKDIEDPNYNQIFYNVYGNYNLYDGLLLGPRIYNETILKKNFIYKITPT